MISVNGIEYLKIISTLHSNTISGGVIYLISMDDAIMWRQASNEFDLDMFKVGDKIPSKSIANRAMKEKRTLIENIPRSLYGMRLKTVAEPIVDDNGNSVGAFSILFPRLHPVIKAFNDFAPVISEMFSEGALIYVTDLQKIICRQASSKFDIPSLVLDYTIEEDSAPYKAIKTKKPVSEEIDASKYGVPALVTCYPLFDEDNNDEIVATLSIIIPKIIASDLINMSSSLEGGLSGISAAMEELAASASQIHQNEQVLNTEIREIIGLTEEINNVSSFIRDIADQTKMLGLNAAIEAARAGEAGKGFGVVANEIRKLSDQSKSTVPKIKKLTDDIISKVDEVSEKSNDSLSASQEQAATSEEITASIGEILQTSEELITIAKKL